MRQSCAAVASLAMLLTWLLAASGCAPVPRSGYVPSDGPGAMTVELDDHDYNLAASGIATEMLGRGLPKGYVVALGPVDTKDCRYDVQVRTLQKSLQVIFNRQGDLKFTAAVDAMAGNSAAAEIYKTLEYNWFKNNPADRDAYQKFGKLASVKGILFGRVSAIERKLPQGQGQEITYRFTWELANTETGIVDLSHEQKIRKNVR
jgi:PBP1b-binding outer membrane lipoprotein LpoB